MLCALLLKILKWRVQQVEKQNLRREERKPGECGRGMRGGVRIEEDGVDMEEEVQGEHEQVYHDERAKRNAFQTTMFTHPYAIVAPITVPHRSPAVRGRRVNMKWCEVMSWFWILGYVLRSAIW